MISQTILIASTVSVIAYALVSGVFLAFSGVVMPSLAASSPAGAIQSMQIINRKVFPTLFMVLLIGMAIVSPLLVGWVLWQGAGPAGPWILAAGASYIAGVFLVSLVFNVPMNERLHRMDPLGAIAEAYWRRYVPGWTFWNTIRWVASAISAACMLMAVLALRLSPARRRLSSPCPFPTFPLQGSLSMSQFPSRPVVLLAAGSLALVIGVAIVIDPVGFHAAGGVRLGTEAGLLNEMRAAGGAILAVGLLALIGVFSVALRTVALTASAVVYAGYGLARLFSFLVDGVPNPTLVWVTVLELVIGAACFTAAAAPSRSKANA